jgi:hypothetical protein
VGKVGIGNIKKIKSPQDLLGELSNLFVRMKKIIPSNLYEATLGHTLVLGIALEQQAYFPESLGKRSWMLLQDCRGLLRSNIEDVR